MPSCIRMIYIKVWWLEKVYIGPENIEIKVSPGHNILIENKTGYNGYNMDGFFWGEGWFLIKI